MMLASLDLLRPASVRALSPNPDPARLAYFYLHATSTQAPAQQPSHLAPSRPLSTSCNCSPYVTINSSLSMARNDDDFSDSDDPLSDDFELDEDDLDLEISASGPAKRKRALDKGKGKAKAKDKDSGSAAAKRGKDTEVRPLEGSSASSAHARLTLTSALSRLRIDRRACAVGRQLREELGCRSRGRGRQLGGGS